MAEPDVLDPSSAGPFFDPAIYSGGPSDFGVDDLDIDVDFSIDDLLDFPEDQARLSLDAPPLPDFNFNASSAGPSPARSSTAGPPSPDSAHSSSSAVTVAGVKSEEGSVGSKRKKGDDAGGEVEEEEKRRARLMRNRESAQLSRQRKKHYVEELEEKVRAMHSTINELHSRVSLVVAENAALRQQLAASTGNAAAAAAPPPAPGVYPMGPVRFPWVPCAGYALRPNGTQVPLVPIPKLKPQQPALAPKGNKSEGKKATRKTKKVASISLLGLLFIMFVCGVNLKYGGDGDPFSSRSQGRVLSVSGRSGQLNGTDEIGLCNGKLGFENGGFDLATGKRCETGPWSSRGSDGSKTNSTEPLLALLYVPRNGRHVKINGNLIIHSVLASERAIADASSRAQSGDPKRISEKEVRKNHSAIHGNVASALAVPAAKRDVEGSPNVKRSSGEGTNGDPYNPTPSEGPLQQWFREGLAGPILNSGMCSEVFQFDVSPSSSSPSGIVPASSIINSTSVNSTSEKLPHPATMKNRRILYPQPIPLTGSTLNNSDHFGEPSTDGHGFHSNKAPSSMVVSVLADPREAGDGDGYGMMSSPKSLSRIFVVVLLDSVKYVTYSCVLPLKSSSPHLVN